DRTFELSLQISADSFRELNKKAARLAIWLSGEGELIFDESDGVIWDAKCISGASFSPERRGKSAVISVIMKSTATGKAGFDTLSGIALSDAPSLFADIPLDFSQYFTFEAPANTVFIPNMGDWWVRPMIKLECEEAIGDIDIVFGEKELHISSAPENAQIDCENFTVTGGNQNLLGYMKGSFFELPPGGGYMSVSVQNPCTVQILYTPKTIYDFDFEAVKWGDDDA
ncbi:MAG: phage tail family protein, partial [Clostridiales bacterium]|nr:phage tail family protein [Clostridiales bacterium]